eukprot:m.227034 g.227034  ORF g.227034 m.227034 type:complete len:1121 (-) comp17108_c0_seq1:180-3542(-)
MNCSAGCQLNIRFFRAAMTEFKAAEKLLILNRHGSGLLARLYQTLQTFNSAERPQFLTEKANEQHLKNLMKKFPVIEVPRSQATPFHARRQELLDNFEEHYQNLVDLLEFKVAMTDVLTAVGAHMLTLDIGINPGLTRAFLDLVCTYLSLMVIMSRIDERRTIAVVYAAAYELDKGTGETNFPRLGQFLVDYDTPLKRMHEDFNPIAKGLADALESLRPIVDRRYVPAEALRKDSPLNMLQHSAKLALPSEHEHIAYDLTSLDQVVRWISLGYLLVPNEIAKQEVFDMLLKVLADGWVVTLFRTEVLQIHAAYEVTLASLRDQKKLSKQKSTIADQHSHAAVAGIAMHAGRRHYLRYTLRTMLLLLADKPGLLGPKAAVALMGMSAVRDEVLWFFRHVANMACKPKGKETIEDQQIPELLYLLTELHGLFLTHRDIVKQYFREFLSTLDLSSIRESFSSVNVTDRGSVLFGSLVAGMEGAGKSDASLAGLRLDYLRLTALMSVQNSPSSLQVQTKLAEQMSQMDFHAMMFDGLTEALFEAGGLSDLWFGHYKSLLLDTFHNGLLNPSQYRYLLAFSVICDSFSRCTTEYLPDERALIGKDAPNIANHVMVKMSQRATEIIRNIGREQVDTASQLLPHNAVPLFVEKASKPTKGAAAATPAKRSAERSKESLAALRQQQQMLSDLCSALNRQSLVVFNVQFCPREYFSQMLDECFRATLAELAMLDAERPQRPSVYLAAVKAFMAALRGCENFINIDVSSVFSGGFLEQTQTLDKPTMSSIYISFYVNFIAENARTGNIIFSPSRQLFVSRAPGKIRAEDYTDLSELRALAGLLGPHGLKQLQEELLRHVSANVVEMKKLSISNKEPLEVIKVQTDRAPAVAEAIKRVRDGDEFVTRSIAIGAILAFRRLLMSALGEVLENRIPFIFHSIRDLHHHTPGSPAVDMLAMTAGLRSDVDPMLLRAMQPHCTKSDADFNAFSLMMVFFAWALRQLITLPNGVFRANLDALENNGHCLAYTVAELSAVFFTMTAKEGELQPAVTEAQSEFLRMASTLLLRLQSGPEREQADPIYVVLDMFVNASPFVSVDRLETYFPYSLIRCAYAELYKKRATKRTGGKEDGAF